MKQGPASEAQALQALRGGSRDIEEQYPIRRSRGGPRSARPSHRRRGPRLNERRIGTIVTYSVRHAPGLPRGLRRRDVGRGHHGCRPRASAAGAGFDLARLDRLDAVIADAIVAHQLPGAVVVVGRGDTVVRQKPTDARSCRRRADDARHHFRHRLAHESRGHGAGHHDAGRRGTHPPHRSVAAFIPAFARYGKDRVTIRDLLTHMSGLRPDLDLAEPWTGSERRSARLRRNAHDPPGRRFVYSDINYLCSATSSAASASVPSTHLSVSGSSRRSAWRPRRFDRRLR